MRHGNALAVLLGALCVPACGGHVVGGDGSPASAAQDSGVATVDASQPAGDDAAACSSGGCVAGESDLDGSPDRLTEAAAADALSSPCNQSVKMPPSTPGGPPQSIGAPWPSPILPMPIPCLPSEPSPGLSCCGAPSCCTGICQDSPSGAICCNPQGSHCDAVNLCCPGLSCSSGMCM